MEMPAPRPTLPLLPHLRFDRRYGSGEGCLVGVDEAGRGALAGPVVAGAVAMPRKNLWAGEVEHLSYRVGDSKVCKPEQREALAADLPQWRSWCLTATGVATVEEVERCNVLGATRLAMRRAVEAVQPLAAQAGWWHEGSQWVRPHVLESAPADDLPLFPETMSPPDGEAWFLLLDGLPMRDFPWVHEGVVKGDGKSFLIGLASIVAKVTRDRLMVEEDAIHRSYGFARHKGYGTKAHWAALSRHGPCSSHRLSFLRKQRDREVAAEKQAAFF